MSSDQESSPFSLLKELPPDFASIYPFLDGRALSTLHLALSVDKSVQASEIRSSLTKSATKRLERIPKLWQAQLHQIIVNSSSLDDAATNGNYSRRSLANQIRPFIQRAINCFHQFQHYVQENGDGEADEWCCRQTRILSEAMIIENVFTFPYDALKQFDSIQPGLPSSSRPVDSVPEWPIWCGKIQIAMWVPRGSFHGFERQILTANVALLSPTWDQIHFPAWHALGDTNNDGGGDVNDTGTNEIDTIKLIAESYNFLPTPPIGRLVGVTVKDQEIVNNMSLRLADQDTVAILSPAHRAVSSRNRYLDSVRIISRSQAQHRISRMPSLPFAFYVKGATTNGSNSAAVGGEDIHVTHGEDLLCCWQYRDLFENAVVTTAQECIPYWKDIALTRDRCLLNTTGEP